MNNICVYLSPLYTLPSSHCELSPLWILSVDLSLDCTVVDVSSVSWQEAAPDASHPVWRRVKLKLAATAAETGRCPGTVWAPAARRIPPGWLNSLARIAITEVNNYFLPQMRGTDPHLRPLNTSNKMIIALKIMPPHTHPLSLPSFNCNRLLVY